MLPIKQQQQQQKKKNLTKAQISLKISFFQCFINYSRISSKFLKDITLINSGLR